MTTKLLPLFIKPDMYLYCGAILGKVIKIYKINASQYEIATQINDSLYYHRVPNHMLIGVLSNPSEYEKLIYGF